MATDARSHAVPAGSDAFDPQGSDVALSLSLNDVVMCANATAETAAIAAIVPTAARPLITYRQDLDVYRHSNGTNTLTIATPGVGSTLTAQSTTTGAATTGADNWAPSAAVTLTPGTWLVQAGMTVTNTVLSDQAACSIRNLTASAEIAGTRGSPAVTNTGGVLTPLISLLAPITVAANTQICPNAHPNGTSALSTTTTDAAGAPCAWITAVRIA